MVGGTVIEVRPTYSGSREVVRLWCMDRHNDECAVYTEPAAELPKPGDRVWWQSGKIYWTPADERFVEKALPKVGFSFDPRRADAVKIALVDDAIAKARKRAGY